MKRWSRRRHSLFRSVSAGETANLTVASLPRHDAPSGPLRVLVLEDDDDTREVLELLCALRKASRLRRALTLPPAWSGWRAPKALPSRTTCSSLISSCRTVAQAPRCSKLPWRSPTGRFRLSSSVPPSPPRSSPTTVF